MGLCGRAQYLDVPLRAEFVTAADTTAGLRAGYGQSCIAEQGAFYLVRGPLHGRRRAAVRLPHVLGPGLGSHAGRHVGLCKLSTAGSSLFSRVLYPAQARAA